MNIIKWTDSYLPPMLYALLIFLLSSKSHPSVDLGHGLDKGVHCLVYAGFGYLVLRAFRKSSRNRPANLLTVIIVILYGISDEFHQALVPGRHFEVLDMVFDGLGGLFAVTFSSVADRYRWPIWFE